ncbi:hypothetical protein [Mycobacterium sp. E2479]|uniref:hypothetical protein n=1 Tax=Mycobacterium sp. E2479 TaxID=1834134 RepID=UPI0007FCC77F|nr:hypothetical protein [Mycobacterium sp. E2479]OBH51298.1 hypothetical protein A5686_12365 [Mycobacterium sp. E2479]
MNANHAIPRTITAGLFAGITVLGFAAPPAPAHADNFVMCPGGHSGVVGDRTSCAFADAVAHAFYACGMCRQFDAYSPETGTVYPMVCGQMRPADFPDGEVLKSVNCYGGDQAEVVVW